MEIKSERITVSPNREGEKSDDVEFVSRVSNITETKYYGVDERGVKRFRLYTGEDRVNTRQQTGQHGTKWS